MSNIELINSEFRLVYEKNAPLTNDLNKNKELVLASITKMVSEELSYVDNDYYVYRGKGGLKIHETPKGVRKVLSRIALKHNLSVVILEGVICDGDSIELVSDGTIEEVKITKCTASLVGGVNILAPYAVVSVFKDNTLITRKLFIVPSNEYKAIKAMGSGNKFETLMAQKSVMKRVSSGIYSLLGVTLDRQDITRIDDMSEAMRVDDEESVEKSTPIDTIEELEKIKSGLDILDKEAVAIAKDSVLSLYSSEVDESKKSFKRVWTRTKRGIK